MYCGCPLPVSTHFVFSIHSGEVHLCSHPHQGKTIGQKLRHLIKSRNRESHEPPDRDDCLRATHPSDHNAVRVEEVSERGRMKRSLKMQERKNRDREKFKRGKLDEKAFSRGLDHEAAFLVPVPTYYGYGATEVNPSGLVRRYGPGCVIVSGLLSAVCVGILYFLIVSYRA